MKNATYLIRVDHEALKKITSMGMKMDVIELETYHDVAKMNLILRLMNMNTIHASVKKFNVKLATDIQLGDIFTVDNERVYSTQEVLDMLHKLQKKQDYRTPSPHVVVERLNELLGEISVKNEVELEKIKKRWQPKD